MIVAVTGGAGFVGSAIIEELLRRGVRVKALARNPAKLPQADNLVPVPGALEDDAALKSLIADAAAVIHCAGVTHARRAAEYDAVNVVGAASAARAAAAIGARFVHVSSLSARVASVSPYAASKAAGETAIAEASSSNAWIALRAPAIYGPRDRATLPYFRLVKAGVAAEPLTKTEPRASLLFIEDAAAAIVAALETHARGVYEIDDIKPEGQSWREIGETLAATLGVKARRVRIPRTAIAAYHAAVRGTAMLTGRPPSVRRGQENEFFHPDWVARDNLWSAAAGWRARTSLKEGFAKTVRWYQENGLL